jgi:hypothetical protein
MEYSPKNMTHGIMVIDPTMVDEDGNIEILHFVGYWEEPSDDAINNLIEELSTDEEFGLTEMMDKVHVLPAPESVVEYFRDVYEEGEDE